MVISERRPTVYSLINTVKSQEYSVRQSTPRVLEKFGNTNVYNLDSKTILNKATGYIGSYDFTLNPYRGCQYGCSYCYAAAFSPNSQMRQDWGNWVIVKQNAVELIEKELKKWYKRNPNKPPTIYMSSVTDPYQPLESQIQLTRGLLSVMIPYQPILVIQTRSPIIVRDIDLLKQFKRLRVNMSIPTGSESVRKDFEPQSPSIQARLNAIGKLRHNIPDNQDHQIRFSITITPLLPIFPEDETPFICKLEVIDRIVIQAFHSASQKSVLAATTRKEAVNLKEKYKWWYDNESEKYNNFLENLKALLCDVEVFEGKAGFGYD